MNNVTENSKQSNQHTAAEKQEILNFAEQTSVACAAEKYGVSRGAIYQWRHKLDAKGPDALADGRAHNKGGQTVPDWKRQKVLAVKESDPGFGPSQIRNQLRRQGITISVLSIRNILKEAGYELQCRNTPKKDYIRFEASRPLELTQIDINEFYIHKQKVYLVLLLDDYSRFLLGFTLLESCNMQAIEQMVASAIQRYGKMERLLSDRGFVFHGWRGINAFEKYLDEMDIYHIHTSPHHPETIGKIEAVNKNIQKELISQCEFANLAEACEKIRQWIWRYNYHRVHQGLDGLCVPADRFHGWLEEVERAMSRMVEDGIDLSIRKVNLFNISLQNGKLVLTIMGRKAYIKETDDAL